VHHDPANASFDNPAPFDNVKAANSRVFLAWSRSWIPTAFSDRLAAVTVTARMSPIVSVRMPRFDDQGAGQQGVGEAGVAGSDTGGGVRVRGAVGAAERSVIRTG
jgi:hypothetical protein